MDTDGFDDFDDDFSPEDFDNDFEPEDTDMEDLFDEDIEDSIEGLEDEGSNCIDEEIDQPENKFDIGDAFIIGSLAGQAFEERLMDREARKLRRRKKKP